MALAAGVVLVAVTGSILLPGAGSAASKQRPLARPARHTSRGQQPLLASEFSGNLPADCMPKDSGPPGSPYQLGLVGTVTNGSLTAGPTSVAHIAAKFCGVVTVVQGTPPCGATGKVVSPVDGQVFGQLSADLTFIPGMQPQVPFVAHPGTITGGFACSTSPAGLRVSLTATVSGSTGLFGLSCTIGPFAIPLSGVLTGPLNDGKVTLTGHDFAVPGATASPTCAGAVPANVDELAGLPLPAGKASVSLTATASIYQPAPAP